MAEDKPQFNTIFGDNNDVLYVGQTVVLSLNIKSKLRIRRKQNKWREAINEV